MQLILKLFPLLKAQVTMDRIVILAILAFSFLVWWPSRYLPYYWDSAGYIIPTARDVYQSNFANLSSRHTDFAHPSLIPVQIAAFWKLFGQSRVVSHFAMFPYLPLLMISVYFWLKKYIRPSYALIGSFLVGTTPTVVTEYVNVYSDLPAAALGAASLWLITTRYQKLALVFFSLGLLAKLPLVTIVPYLVYKLRSNQRIFLSIPLLTIIGWLIYHYIDMGWWLVRPGRSTHMPMTVQDIYSSTIFVFRQFFLQQGRLLWTLIPLVFLAKHYKTIAKKLQANYEALAVGAALIGSLAFFVTTGEYSHRYGIYILPLFVLVILVILQQSKLNLLLKYGTIVGLLLVGVYYWKPAITNPNQFSFQAPTDLTMLDAIRSFRELAMHLQITAKDAYIYGAFPENGQLTDPLQGYVTEPLNFSLCNEFSYNPQQKQLVVIHPYSPSQYPCIEILNALTLTPIRKFDTNGKWVELYQVEASQSAVTKK